MRLLSRSGHLRGKDRLARAVGVGCEQTVPRAYRKLPNLVTGPVDQPGNEWQRYLGDVLKDQYPTLVDVEPGKIRHNAHRGVHPGGRCVHQLHAVPTDPGNVELAWTCLEYLVQREIARVLIHRPVVIKPGHGRVDNGSCSVEVAVHEVGDALQQWA